MASAGRGRRDRYLVERAVNTKEYGKHSVSVTFRYWGCVQLIYTCMYVIVVVKNTYVLMLCAWVGEVSSNL